MKRNKTGEVQKTTKPKRQKETKGFQPPRGITFVPLPQSAKKPHGVQWRVDGKRKTRGFPTLEQRDTFARSLAGDVKAAGVDAYRLDEAELRDWRAFRAEVGQGADLREIARHWVAHGKEDAPTVTVAVTDFLAAKKSEGISAAAYSHYKKWLGRFSAAFGARQVSSITRDEISPWLATLGLGDVTTHGHFVRVRSLFTWLVNIGKLARNPCNGIKAPKITPEDVEVLTVTDGGKLFAKATADTRELFGRLALESFAGLRFASASVIAGADIDFAARGIVLPAAKIKTRRRQFIDGLPENLWAWLEWSKPAAWVMTPRQYLEAKSLAFVRADIPHPRNCLRHSFASYHVAAHKDASRTSVILCHSSPAMLWRHYKGRATEADGLAWFGIVPKIV
jgi:site-specific recombinase XerC